jgi:hypothetical protein
VKIYRIWPDSKYEHISIVKAQSEEWWTQQEAMDRVVEELKKQAAKTCANGVVFGGLGDKYETYSGYTPYAGGGGHFWSGTTEKHQLSTH